MTAPNSRKVRLMELATSSPGLSGNPGCQAEQRVTRFEALVGVMRYWAPSEHIRSDNRAEKTVGGVYIYHVH